MTLGEDNTAIAGLALTLIVAIIAGYWQLARGMVKQFKADLKSRFEEQERLRAEGRRQSDERLRGIEESHRALERDFLKHQADLPKEYVRREDHIRYETVVNAKLDALGSKLDVIAERTAKGA